MTMAPITTAVKIITESIKRRRYINRQFSSSFPSETNLICAEPNNPVIKRNIETKDVA
jgi:hypothetical protein